MTIRGDHARRGALAVATSLTLLAPAVAQTQDDACTCVAQGEVAGFWALAMVTDMADYLERWNTPRDTSPQYTSPEGGLFLGESGHLMVLFSTPGKNADGVSEILCDVVIANPDGTTTTMPPTTCFKGALGGPATDLILTGLQIDTTVESSDPSGVLSFDIGVTDAVRDVRVPLHLELEIDSRQTRPGE